jgi:hypothetical protein
MEWSELARLIGIAWEKLPQPRHSFSLEVICDGRPSAYINLGPHPPRLWPEDIDRVHELWLRLSSRLGVKLHHRDVVSVALRRLERDLDGYGCEETIRDIQREIHVEESPETTPSAIEGPDSEVRPTALAAHAAHSPEGPSAPG